MGMTCINSCYRSREKNDNDIEKRKIEYDVRTKLEKPQCGMSMVSTNIENSQRNYKMKKEDFKLIQCLGKGSFGKVFLVEKIDNCNFFFFFIIIMPIKYSFVT